MINRGLVFIASLTIFASISVSVSAQSADISSDEYVVYGAVIDQVFNQGRGWLLISSRTASFDCNDQAIPIQVGGCSSGMRDPQDSFATALKAFGARLSGLSRSLLNDFGSKNEVGHVLPSRLQTSRKYYRFENGGGHVSLPEGTPDFLLVFSRVGLNSDRTQALVYVAAATWLPGGPSGGFVVLLSSRGDAWIAQRPMQLWQLTAK